MWPFKKIDLGELKILDDVTIDDFRQHNVWVCDLSGENKDGYDETAIKPILNDDGVTSASCRKFVSTEFLVWIPSLQLFGTATYHNRKTIANIGIQNGNKIMTPHECKLNRDEILIIESIPSFFGKNQVTFQFDYKTAKALVKQ
ncbi:MAG: hypothetical protein HRU15_00260 [Planctomycetes bacterium]|nr:hypothetical protein [Planctomycetota bacterium]